MAGNLQGARTDVEKALSGVARILPDDPESNRRELLALHAKLAFMAHDDATTSHDLHEIIDAYSSDIQFLTDGRVKLTDKTPDGLCGWTAEDIEQWLQRSNNAPEAQIFRSMFTASFAPLDDNAKALTARYTAEAIRANPSFAPAYFYAAVGSEKITAYKALAFSETERTAHNNSLIALWSKAIQLNASIEEAYAERADEYLSDKDYSATISDYDWAIALTPNDAALWNDRGLAKQETYDKSGAITDFTHAIALKTQNNDLNALTYSLDNRADLYMKLKDYKQALDDYTALIAARFHNIVVFINLDFFRELYPEYRTVSDAKLKSKLHRMYVPNYTDQMFEQEISKPEGLHPSLDCELPEAYLKRADTLLALKRFSAARADYYRTRLFANRQDDERWRTPSGLHGMAVDLQTLETKNSRVNVWVKLPENSDQSIEQQPTRFAVDCQLHTIQMGDRSSAAFDPTPGSYAEVVRDFFCASSQ